jgi:hypothetical protein
MGPQGDPGFVTILMGLVVIAAAVLGGPAFLVKAIPFAEHQAVMHWTQQPRRAAGMVGLTNTRQLHEAALARLGKRETRERLAAARRLNLALPEGSLVLVRVPPVRGGQAAPAGRRRS